MTTEFYLDEVIDDYYHTLVRNQPWQKPRYEPALNRMTEWFEAQFAGGPAPIEAFTPEALESYLATVNAGELADAAEATQAFSAWAEHVGYIKLPMLADGS